MINYKLTKKMGGALGTTIIKIVDGVVVSSFEPGSRAYREYEKWLALGNIPLEADDNNINP